jgi:hypothetical protein
MKALDIVPRYRRDRDCFKVAAITATGLTRANHQKCTQLRRLVHVFLSSL